MTRKASKSESKAKDKTRKLKLNKETVKDLDPEEPSAVKGGMLTLLCGQLSQDTPASCGFSYCGHACQTNIGCYK